MTPESPQHVRVSRQHERLRTRCGSDGLAWSSALKAHMTAMSRLARPCGRRSQALSLAAQPAGARGPGAAMSVTPRSLVMALDSHPHRLWRRG